MIDPQNITNYNHANEELQEDLVFWILAAGKNATTTAKQLENMLTDLGRPPFKTLKNITPEKLKSYGFGCYNLKARAIRELIRSGLNLKTCTAEELETIPGIGLKTSRGFIIHSRPNAQHACLDTHILKFLRKEGIDAPKSTPTKRKYRELEIKFIELAKKSGKSIAAYDLSIWKEYSGNK
jgi:thermostable 8-oxoguanine DNA glycosylase